MLIIGDTKLCISERDSSGNSEKKGIRNFSDGTKAPPVCTPEGEPNCNTHSEQSTSSPAVSGIK